MVQANQLVLGLVLLTMMVGAGGAAEQQFSCKGQLIDEGTKLTDQSNPIDLNLSLGDKNNLSMKTGDGKFTAPDIGGAGMSGFGISQRLWAPSAAALRSAGVPGKASPIRRGGRIAKRIRRREPGKVVSVLSRISQSA
jgi:hypothetical protein